MEARPCLLLLLDFGLRRARGVEEVVMLSAIEHDSTAERG